MNQITLLEFCQVPENRIKLMEYLIDRLQNEDDYYLCWIINECSQKFKEDNNILESRLCIGEIQLTSNSTILLSSILPELLKYKHNKPSWITEQSVWFYSFVSSNAINTRIKALTNAINDIKNNLT